MAQLLISNPHAGLDTEGGWAMGFRWGFVGPAFSSNPPIVIAPEQFDAFNEGVLAGQQAAISGLAVDTPCAAPDSGSHDLTDIFHVGEAGAATLSFLLKHFVSGAVEVLVLGFTLMIPALPPADPVGEFGGRAADLSDRLRELGLADKQLFLGAGVDESDLECPVLLTPIFRSIEGTRESVASIGRPHFLISRWDAAVPVSGGGFDLVETDLP